MRSSKTRSRSKSNRNRSMGNIVNRVFDSSGPEGKVRGTPQQIIEKYNQLARDAQVSNDRVAAENFQQHSEHYTRLLSEAQREQEARREQQQDQEPRRSGGRGPQQNGPGGGEQQAGRDNERSNGHDAAAGQGSAGQGSGAEVIDVAGDAPDDTGLVETPESKPQRPRRARKPKAAKDDAANGDDQPGTSETAD